MASSGVTSQAGFPDLFDSRFKQMVVEEASKRKDWVREWHNVVAADQLVERMTEVTPMEDMLADFESTGTLQYTSPVAGYNATRTHRQWALGTKVQRKFFEFQNHGEAEERFTSLGYSVYRRRQRLAHELINNGFSYDTTYYTYSEGLSWFNDSHTTTTDASTTNGFDNLVTLPFDAAGLQAAIIQFNLLRDPVGEIMENEPTFILYPYELKFRVEEVLQSVNKPHEMSNTKNVLQGELQPMGPNKWLTSSTRWFIGNKEEVKRNLFWSDKVNMEPERVKDFDTKEAKYSTYGIWSFGRRGWRGMLASNV